MTNWEEFFPLHREENWRNFKPQQSAHTSQSSTFKWKQTKNTQIQFKCRVTTIKKSSVGNHVIFRSFSLGKFIYFDCRLRGRLTWKLDVTCGGVRLNLFNCPQVCWKINGNRKASSNFRGSPIFSRSSTWKISNLWGQIIQGFIEFCEFLLWISFGRA